MFNKGFISKEIVKHDIIEVSEYRNTALKRDPSLETLHSWHTCPGAIVTDLIFKGEGALSVKLRATGRRTENRKVKSWNVAELSVITFSPAGNGRSSKCQGFRN
jgi:hypothetical protein